MINIREKKEKKWIWNRKETHDNEIAKQEQEERGKRTEEQKKR